MKVFLSILRQHQYEYISKLKLNGEILDLGGCLYSGYHELIQGKHHITTINIDPKTGCDVIGDIQKQMPFKQKSLDSIICFNVLEHIYEYDAVFAECTRLLKSRGKLIISTPFMHHIHGSPDDYFRYTKSALHKILTENNFNKIEIYELGFGFFSLVFQIICDITPKFARNILKAMFVNMDKVLLKISLPYQRLAKRIPLGYFVVAQKI